ncbi:hypothetical protein NIES21_55320 [Anabaenopsis circularis NIES-21]|uniref:Uncharacterized protein n=1 Tax=Anabaenopsis circularis NIES-21 TaxID=1085406 RepID=A0A1Z4GQA4_9CYAN|nr:hypothetical protein NIES21_55320 [Anabaenopsis circularis NIES-21]
MKSFVKTVSNTFLPYTFSYRLRQLYRQQFGRLKHDPSEQDIVIYEIQPQVLIKVYWKILPIGKGPALELIVSGDHILRFDCFGEDDGHYHIFSGYEYPDRDRIYFPEKTVTEQINRTIFELNHNLSCFLQLHRSRDIRNLKIDAVALKSICEQARQQMLYYLLTVPQFDDLRIPNSQNSEPLPLKTA